ncbi:MAG: glycosyltransferase family 39 protein [Pseudomonadota bacterium]
MGDRPAGAGPLARAATKLEALLAALLAGAAASPARAMAVAGLVALLATLPGLTSLPVTDRDEARFAQATKQMHETGDLVDIRFQDAPRWKKPVGIYWLQAATTLPFGGAEASIWAYRLPSLLGAVLGAMATLWAARALLAPPAALLAGLALGTTVLVAAESTIAKTDAALMLTAVLALGALLRVLVGQAGRGTWLVFWLAMAAAILLKGPIVPLIALLALGAVALADRRVPSLAALRPLPGIGLTVLLVAPWLITIWIISDGRFFAESVGEDLLGKVAEGKEKHWGPPGLYSAIVWGTFWPWAAFLPGALAAAWAARSSRVVLLLAAWVLPWLVAIWEVSGGGFFAEAVGEDLLGKVSEGKEKHWGPPGLYTAIVWGTFWPLAGLLPGAIATLWARRAAVREGALMVALAWILPFWIVLEAVPTKLPHYVLPLYPALAILVAWHVLEGEAPARRWLVRAGAVVTALPGLALGLAAIVLPVALEGRLVAGAALLGLAGAVLALVAGRAALQGRMLAQAGAGGLSALAVIAAALQFALPALDSAFATPRLVAMAEPWRACGQGPLVSIGYREPSLVFTAGTDTLMPTTDEGADLLARPGAVALVTDRRRARLEALMAERGGPRLVERDAHRYFNYNRGNWETTRLMTADDPRFDACG